MGRFIALEARPFWKSAGELSSGSAGCLPVKPWRLAGKLAVRYVIHTVGPFWSGGQRDEPETLASCHRESIRIADELQLASIAFPAISTGAYRYPVEQAAQVAVSSAAGALEKAAHLREVRFVLFDGGTVEQYAEAARKVNRLAM